MSRIGNASGDAAPRSKPRSAPARSPSRVRWAARAAGSPLVKVERRDGKAISFVFAADESREAKAMHGTLRALVAGMVKGVTTGFEKQAARWSASAIARRPRATSSTCRSASRIPIVHAMPKGVKVETPIADGDRGQGHRQAGGRPGRRGRSARYRPPEPYKGKGVRYADEIVVMKETKKK